MNRAAYKGFLGVTVVEEICRTTDLDYADDVSLLASMLEILVPALEILHEESSQIGQEINWSKTKLQAFDYTSTPPSKVSVLDHDVEVVSSFVYLGSCIEWCTRREWAWYLQKDRKGPLMHEITRT